MRLSLQHNAFSGTLPANIGASKQLIYLNFENNQIEGSIPPSFVHLTALDEANLQCNRLTGDLPAGFMALPLLNMPGKLLLKGNQFHGSIQQQLPHSFGMRPRASVYGVARAHAHLPARAKPESSLQPQPRSHGAADQDSACTHQHTSVFGFKGVAATLARTCVIEGVRMVSKNQEFPL